MEEMFSKEEEDLGEDTRHEVCCLQYLLTVEHHQWEMVNRVAELKFPQHNRHCLLRWLQSMFLHQQENEQILFNTCVTLQLQQNRSMTQQLPVKLPIRMLYLIRENSDWSINRKF